MLLQLGLELRGIIAVGDRDSRDVGVAMHALRRHATPNSGWNRYSADNNFHDLCRALKANVHPISSFWAGSK